MAKTHSAAPAGGRRQASSVPINGLYAGRQADALAAYQGALTSIDNRRSGLLQRYGYDSTGSLDSTNPYGLYQQGERDYTQALDQLDTSRGRTERDANESLGRLDTDHGTTLGRMQSDHDLAQQRYADLAQRAQHNAGLNVLFDANGNPTSTDITADNEHSGYRNLLLNQADELDTLDQNAVDRGLGGEGLGAQGSNKARFRQAGALQDFRQNLLDQMMDNVRGRQDENTSFTRSRDDENLGYTRSKSDMQKMLSDALADFTKQRGNIDYGHGLGQYNLGLDFAGDLHGLDDAALNARTSYTGSLRDATLESITNRIKTGDFNAPPNPKTKPGRPRGRGGKGRSI